MNANEKKPVKKKKTVMKNTVVSDQNHFGYLSIEINLTFNEAVRASDDPEFCDVCNTI